MSWGRITIIYCDSGRDDCPHRGDPLQSYDREPAREMLRESGWHARPGGRHICPECWDAGAR